MFEKGPIGLIAGNHVFDKITTDSDLSIGPKQFVERCLDHSRPNASSSEVLWDEAVIEHKETAVVMIGDIAGFTGFMPFETVERLVIAQG